MEYYVGTVLSDEIVIRTGPATSYRAIEETLKKGDTIICTKIERVDSIVWVRHNLGWSIAKYNQKDSIALEKKDVVRVPEEEDDEENSGTDDSGAESERTEADESDTSEDLKNLVTLTDVLEGLTEKDELSKACMQLFGMPYQLNRFADIRFNRTNKTIGRTYLENIAAQGPILTVIPCRPRYLGSVEDEQSIQTLTQALTDWVSGGSALSEAFRDQTEDFRYYDLRVAYRECMRYINLLCRFSASMLGIGNVEYPPGSGTLLVRYDWKDYRFDGSKYRGVAGKAKEYIGQTIASVGDKIKGMLTMDEYTEEEKAALQEMAEEVEYEEDDSISNFFMTSSYIQFYCDADLNSTDTFENETTTSKIKGMFDTLEDWGKEIQFITNSLTGNVNGEVNAFTNFITGGVDFLGGKIQDVLGGSFSTVGGVLNKFLTLGSNVLGKGETIVIPDIYSGSSRRTSYTINMKLRAVYGNVLSQYFDITVPILHWLGICAPQQTSSNTYGAPFLVKAIYDGVFTCNMGLVTGLDITRSSANNWTIFGLPNEVDVSVTLVDLYSDISITPPDKPIMFLNNVPLIEFLAMSCGINVLKPNLAVKASLNWTTIVNSITDIGEYLVGNELDKLENFSISNSTLMNGLSFI